jgi:PHD/YefM family antitoxin component YafN of YafNO toxin-antitoxin module
MAKAKPESRRLAATEAREELSSILHAFAEVGAPSDSIADRAVRLGIYNRDAGVLVPLADFERALETEEILDDILLELSVAERLARGTDRWHSLEDVARELGLAEDLGI